jgi:hypothetical protein
MPKFTLALVQALKPMFVFFPKNGQYTNGLSPLTLI